MSWIGKGDDAPEPDEETRAKRKSGSGSGARLRIVLRCTFCHDALTQREAVYCALCLAPHHHDCQRTHGRCAAPGCVCPATIRPRSTSTRQQAVRPRIPSGPRAALLNLPVLLGIVAGTAGLAGSATAMALTVRPWSATQVVFGPAPRARPPEERWSPPEERWSAVTLTANGFSQTVELGPAEVIVVATLNDATQAFRLPRRGPAEVVFTLLPAGPVEVRASGAQEAMVVEPDREAGTFSVLPGHETSQEALLRRLPSADEWARIQHR